MLPWGVLLHPDVFGFSFCGTPIGEDVDVGSFMLYGHSPGPGVGGFFVRHDPLGDHEHVCCPHFGCHRTVYRCLHWPDLVGGPHTVAGVDRFPQGFAPHGSFRWPLLESHPVLKGEAVEIGTLGGVLAPRTWLRTWATLCPPFWRCLFRLAPSWSWLDASSCGSAWTFSVPTA